MTEKLLEPWMGGVRGVMCYAGLGLALLTDLGFVIALGYSMSTLWIDTEEYMVSIAIYPGLILMSIPECNGSNYLEGVRECNVLWVQYGRIVMSPNTLLLTLCMCRQATHKDYIVNSHWENRCSSAPTDMNMMVKSLRCLQMNQSFMGLDLVWFHQSTR